jgi:hypothetical protein
MFICRIKHIYKTYDQKHTAVIIIIFTTTTITIIVILEPNDKYNAD